MSAGLRGTRGETGRGSAGAREAARRLDPDEVRARREHWHAQPPSPERTRALTLIRSQLKNIANRPENRS